MLYELDMVNGKKGGGSNGTGRPVGLDQEVVWVKIGYIYIKYEIVLRIINIYEYIAKN